MSAVGQSNTRPEVRLRCALHALGYRYRVNYPVRVSNHVVRPDVVFTKQRIAVFLDGCFWHACPDHGQIPKTNEELWAAKFERNAARDCEQTELLTAAGWKVIRIWEHESVPTAISKIERVYDSANR